MKVVWSPLALERVEDIARYIAEDNPGAAHGGLRNFLPPWSGWPILQEVDVWFLKLAHRA